MGRGPAIAGSRFVWVVESDSDGSAVAEAGREAAAPLARAGQCFAHPPALNGGFAPRPRWGFAPGPFGSGLRFAHPSTTHSWGVCDPCVVS